MKNDDDFRLDWHEPDEKSVIVPFTTIVQMIDGVDFDEKTECLNFVRKSAMKDHPALSFGNGHTIRLDRLMLMFELDKPAPAGGHVLHSCNNPRCCAPWHMRWSTSRNEDDRASGDKVERALTARAGAAIRFCEGVRH